MASIVSDHVYDEKVDAMKRFERKKHLSKYLPAIEALVVVFLLLSWLTPSLFAGEYLWPIVSGGLTGGIFAFGVVNVLIALIFSLSNHQKLTEPDLYFQYVSSSASAPVDGFSSSSAVVSEPSAFENEEKASEEKPRTDFNSVVTPTDTALSAGEARPMKREMVRAVSSVTETAHTIRRKREMTFLPPASSENATDHHQLYRRSRSERLDMRSDLRRSMRRLCDMDDLSNDEFRSKVERFIAGKKKKMLSKDWVKILYL